MSILIEEEIDLEDAAVVEAEEQFDKGNYDKGLTIYEELFKEQISKLGRILKDIQRVQTRVIAAHHMTILIEKETAYHDAVEEAEKLYDEGNYGKALSIFEQLLKKNSELGSLLKDILHILTKMVAVCEKQIKYAEAIESLISLYKIKLRVFGILNASTWETRCTA